jgi:hypothetical protein
VNAPISPLKIRIEVLAMLMGELALDEVASQPSEAERPVLVAQLLSPGSQRKSTWFPTLVR